MTGGYLFFGWVNQLVNKGAAQTQLQYGDLLPTPPESTPQRCTRDLWNSWTKLCTKGKPSLLRAIIGAYGKPYFRLGALKFLNDGLTFAGAMLLNLLVKHLEHATAAPTDSSNSNSSANGLPSWFPSPGDASWGFMLALLLGLSAVAKAVISSHYNYRLSVITVRLRGGVMGVLFRSALLTRAADAAGDVSTLMAVDTGRLANICVSVHELWSLPLQIAAAMWLLYVQVRTAFIAGVLLCLALVPVNRLIAQKIQAASIDLMSAKDSRLALMGEVLRHIGVVKALGWEQVMADKVHGYRHDELSALALRKYLDALCVYFWAATQLLLSGTTFGLMVLLGQPLQPSVVFTCLALFNVLIAPLNAFPWVVNGVVEALVSLRRVQAYCMMPQRAIGWAYSDNMLPSIIEFQQQQQRESALLDSRKALKRHHRGQRDMMVLSKQQQQLLLQKQQPGSVLMCDGRDHAGSKDSDSPQLQHGVAAQFHNATFTWRKGLPPCLHYMQLSVPAGCLTAVVGEVGSGKSSLLAALLGELDVTDGYALLPNHQVMRAGFSGYVPQGYRLLRSEAGHPGFSGEGDDKACLLNPHGSGGSGLLGVDNGSSSSSSDHGGGKPWRPRRVSYVGQSPWLMRGSVRDNILLGQPYDAELMGEILHAVGLDQDLAAMPAGDLSCVGDGGSSLSGGQRIRVALARALYQNNTDTFILDDILAGLDNHVAQWVIRHALFGGLLQGCTVVLVTKHPLVIQSAQLVVGLEHGRVAYCGSAQGFAHWKAMQAAGPTAATNGWVPLVRPSSPHRQPPPLPSLSLRHHRPTTTTANSHSQLGSSPPGQHHPGVGAKFREDLSEDVAPSELLLAGGHGVWACHASTAPQLNAISEDDSALLGRSLSRELRSALGDNQEHTLPQAASKQQLQQEAGSAAAAAAHSLLESQTQQQQQQQRGNNASYYAGPAEADAAAAAAAIGHEPPLCHARGDCDSGEQQQQQQSDGEECRAVGAVRWCVYVSYMNAVGGVMCAAVLVSLIMMQATKNGIDLWVTRSLTHPSNTTVNIGTPVDNMSSVTLPVISFFSTADFHTSIAHSAAAAVSVATVYEGRQAAAAAAAAAAQAPCQDNPSLHQYRLSCHQQQHHQQQWQQQDTTPNFVMYISDTSNKNNNVKSDSLWLSCKWLLGSLSKQGWAWHPAHLTPDMIYFLKGLGVIAALNTLATLARAFSFAAAGMAAARSTHELLLTAVLGAKMTFFDSNPAGRILNRFSSDTSMIDDSLPFILNILLANAVSLAGLLAVLLLGQPLLALLLLPLAVAYRRLQLYYRSSARELRRLEAAALSPIYSTFGDAVQGAATLRAAAAQQHFMKEFLLTMDPYQAACLNNAAAANWLGARLQLLAAVLLSAVAAVAAAVAATAAAAASNAPASYKGQVMSHNYLGALGHAQLGGSSSSSSSAFRINLLGLALAYCLPIVQLLNGLLTSSAETEQEMVSVERVMASLQDITPEEQQQQQHDSMQISPAMYKRMQRQEWQRQRLYGQQQQQQMDLHQPLLPDHHQQQQQRAAPANAAAIEFTDVVMCYRPGLPAALRGVSFSVQQGQKLGICGRTGAGKSSIIAALLRLRPIESGHILVAGADVSQLSLADLRGLRCGVVPQTPVLFSGTLRDNLDPNTAATDEELAAALQAVHLWGTLCSIALRRGVLGHGAYLLARRAVTHRRWPISSASGPAAAAAAAMSSTSLSTQTVVDLAAGSQQDIAASITVGDGGDPWLSEQQGLQQRPSAAASSSSSLISSADGDPAASPDDDDEAEVSLTSAALTEGAAAAIGAAAGRAAAAAAVLGVLQSPRHHQYSSGRGSWEFPPVPMYPASKVLAMKVGGSCGLQLSAGESQLVCVARLLLRRCPIVLLDEATAAVDHETAALIHQVLHEQLDVSSNHSVQKPTVLQVAHELSAIVKYDRVAVMSAGRVVESGNPVELAAQQDSRFAAMLAQAGHQHTLQAATQHHFGG